MERMKSQRVVLVLIGDAADGPQGLLLHPALALSASRAPRGALQARLLVRDPADFHKSRQRPKLRLEIIPKSTTKLA